jgi:hypothetical protein
MCDSIVGINTLERLVWIGLAYPAKTGITIKITASKVLHVDTY